MDFFNRLLRRANTAAPAAAASRARAGRQSISGSSRSTPQQRLAALKAVYSSLLRLWRNGQGVSRDAFVAENVRVVVVRLAQILNGDIRGPTPHLCISFAFNNGMIRTLVQIATAFCETGLTSEVLGVLQLVVDNEEEAFLEDRGLADAIPPFVEAVRKDILGRQWGNKEEEVEKVLDREVGLEARLAEVLFGIASAIRNKHLVLKAWFRPEQIYEDEDELTEEEKATRSEDFPLFYLLLDHISANGRIGDFARMGLLYIVEATSYSSVLEKWLIEGDMAALMASSLGALYSQLSRKLILAHVPGKEPLFCKYGSIKAVTRAPFDVDVMGSDEYQERTRTFMASLNFWQDMLNHSPFDNIRKTLLDHFQALFLQQLLYPSLLESDIDGGSAVAVTTYLRNILQEVDHPELLNRTLSYLFGVPIKEEELDHLANATTKARRRKSEILFSRSLQDTEKPTPELFNLSDLINSGLRSRSQQTVTVTLRLLSTLITRQHQQALPHLFKTRPIRMVDQKRSLGGHMKELDAWINLAASLTSLPEIEKSYEDAVYDNQSMLEAHPCTYQVKAISVPNSKQDPFTRPLNPYAILPEDPLTKSLVRLLERFLINDIELNLDLTKVVLSISSCAHLRLEGWLVTPPARYIYRKPDGTPQTPKVEKHLDVDTDKAIEDEEETEKADEFMPPAREEPAWHLNDCSSIFQALDRVVAQVESYHRALHDFDLLLSECRSTIIPTSPGKSKFDISEQPFDAIKRLDRTGNGADSLTATPVRGHARKTSLANRVASAFGTSPRNADSAPNNLLEEPTLAQRLEMRLSAATGSERPRSSRRPLSSGGEALEDSLITMQKPSSNGTGRTETPRKAILGRRKSFRGDDINATPSPRLNRLVVPGIGRGETEGSALKHAIGRDSDDEEDGEDDDENDEVESEDDSDRDLNSVFEGDQSPLRTRGGLLTDEVSRRSSATDSRDDDAEEHDLEQDSDERDGKLQPRRRREGSEALPNRDITVGHLLTNVIILQGFIVEMAAMISVRGTMFDEIRFG